ncbi:D-alanyl-D-alanine carboxypeptidase [Paenibacillus oceani]|uniref:D-alanyl-D-alanine carboxypeptidase n=1 Tax=Paenibacillus oceani TaxID=2772510 RepID=A0A927CDD6_9BACL|nr:D-alanyl-D-alanine carboxypeptidase [Paenibacillus oceani]MBD2863755.1 D-alanyl-D-alanine carboxypeptidase [Paenibacillus oceani]
MKRLTVAALGIALLILVAGNTFGEEYMSKAKRWMDRTIGGGGAILASDGIQASHALVIDAANGKTLYSKNERERAYPASTTKILTGLLALELGKPDELVTVGEEVAPEDPEESRAGLRPGQRLKLFDLVEAALLPSGNDAARSIAVYIGRKAAGNPKLGIREAQLEFVKLMNKRAKKAGATHSNFVNATGLHERKHYSTAQDLALIAKEAMNNKLFRQAVQPASYTAAVQTSANPSAKLQLTNTNLLLQPGGANYLKEATGIKTGFTDQAGYCLVSSASKDGKQVIVVVLQSTNKDVYPDARKLLQQGLEKASRPAK